MPPFSFLFQTLTASGKFRFLRAKYESDPASFRGRSRAQMYDLIQYMKVYPRFNRDQKAIINTIWKQYRGSF